MKAKFTPGMVALFVLMWGVPVVSFLGYSMLAASANGLPQTAVIPRGDISLDPIPAEEPIPPAGFPPLPDRLDLPIATSGNWSRDAQSSQPTASPTDAGAPGQTQPTFHQHYGHVAPGAYLQQNNQGGACGSPGYYRARTPGADYYNTNTGAGQPGTPAYTGATVNDLRALGREPTLNDRQGQTASEPAPPDSVIVNQAKTQDLSLPEDDFNYKYKAPSKPIGSTIRNNLLYKVIQTPLNSVGGMAGIHF